ncbi:MAG: formylglycine-generating enzyme family protein [Acidobacteriota bacterium]
MSQEPGETELSERGGVELVRIPGGRFVMGTPEDEEGRNDDETQREVEVGVFWLGRHAVTNEEYGRFLADSGADFEPAFWDHEELSQPRQPVVGVTWDAARAFCSWAGGRLPAEAEWEWACRAGTTTRYWSGDGEDDLARVGWYRGNSGGRLHDVGELEANAFGLHDMHGNVDEWCLDEDDFYWVNRGGSWENTARICRSAHRSWEYREELASSLGFRLARDAG